MIGEYGRTNLGSIIKFSWLEKEPGIRDDKRVILVDKMIETANHFYYFKKNEFIKKHSKNIIDLIEVGDIVNGKQVLKTGRSIDCDCDIAFTYLDYFGQYFGINAEEIKSILTHEMYSKNCYKVAE